MTFKKPDLAGTELNREQSTTALVDRFDKSGALNSIALQSSHLQVCHVVIRLFFSGGDRQKMMSKAECYQNEVTHNTISHFV